MDYVTKLKELLSGVEVDIKKFFDKGNDAAGLRVRNTIKEFKAILNELRKETLKKSK